MRRYIVALFLVSVVTFFIVPTSHASQRVSNGSGQWYDIGSTERSCSDNYYCFNGWIGDGEGGLDLGLPCGTPVTSIQTGRIISSGWYWGGGVVVVRGWSPYFRHDEDIYVQHLTAIYRYSGPVSRGDLLGRSNCWIEFGLNPPWGHPWDSYTDGLWHPGPWINPLHSGFLNYLRHSSSVTSQSVQHVLDHHTNTTTTQTKINKHGAGGPAIVPNSDHEFDCDSDDHFRTGVISRGDAIVCAKRAGFSNRAADIIVAIAQAESDLHVNAEGNLGEAGLLQIFLAVHPGVTQECAVTPSCAFRAGFDISSGGTDFTPWTTYTDGQYLQFLH